MGLKLLTVVMPVYNSENFLKNALNSVLASSYKNLEIICVNDASTDNSLDILEEYKKKDKRIIIINKVKNEGAMEAREEAYRICRGEYITNVDSDDFIEEDTFEKAIKAFELEENIDISLYDAYYFKKEKDSFFKINKFLNGKILIGKDAFLYSLDWKISGLGIFKRDILLRSLDIPKTYNGDEVITRKVFLNSKKIYLSEGKYIYRINENSLTKSKSFNKRRIEMLISSNYILSLAKEKNIIGKDIEKYKVANITLFIKQALETLENKKKLNIEDKNRVKEIISIFEKNWNYKLPIKFFIKHFEFKSLGKLLLCIPLVYFYIFKLKRI